MELNESKIPFIRRQRKMIQFLLERICINYEHSVEPISSLGYGECRPISEALMIQHIIEAWPKRTPLIFFSLLQRLDSVNGLVCFFSSQA